jgi:hypothetical protein
LRLYKSFANAQETKFVLKGLNLANFSGDIEDGSTLAGLNIGICRN